MTEDKGILIRNIYYMLSYAFHELKQNNYAQIEGERFENIHDLFAEILTKGISLQLKQGLYREYIPRKEVMTTVRGKIDMNETGVCRTRNSHCIVCNYDELSENNIYNRIIVTTVNLLLRHSDVKKEKKARLKQLMLFFSNVQMVAVGSIHWNLLHFDRNNRSYRMLLYICYFILDGMLMTTETGQYKMREFSEEHMNRLFEKFVLEYYKKHHPKLNARADQVKWNIENKYSTVDLLPKMQTDIMLTLNERTLIVDTKYYGQSLQHRYGKSSIHSGNLYQIHTYITEHDKKQSGNVDGMLLYARTQELIVPDGQMRLATGNTIYFRTLDLNQNFSEIKKCLNRFVEYKITSL